jgi:ATP-dependent helicase/nuclease subunit B
MAIRVLTLVLGRAGTGKTGRVMEDVKRRGEAGERGLLLVPEQFSHSAERQLCRVCGDALSMYGEVVTFTGLCSKVFAEMGGADAFLDEGALILAMWRAFESVRPRMRAYAGVGKGTDFLERLLVSAREFKSAGITPEALGEAAYGASDALREKLLDLSLILGAYGGALDGGRDPADKLTALAELVPHCECVADTHIYIDGFSDFTAQEFDVIKALLVKCGRVTVCLTCGDLLDDEDVFELPRSTAMKLTRLADGDGARCDMLRTESAGEDGRAGALRYMERRMFSPDGGRFGGDAGGAVALYGGLAPYAECELAAAETLRLVRAGCRWRDIAVIPCDESGYAPLCESVFERYGIPLFTDGRADLLQKPPVALIIAALETVAGDWEYTRVFRYLKTGLTGLSLEECCELENYALTWDIRRGRKMWTRDEPWTLPVSGYGRESDGDADRLERIDGIRRRVAAPLAALEETVRGVSACGGKLEGLLAFLERIGLPAELDKKAAELAGRGELRAAEEYSRIWETVRRVCEQFEKILGRFETDGGEFARLFALAVSRYDIEVIPVSLDRVTLGGMARSRRRDVKCLIVLGASDDMLPHAADAGGVLSDSERGELAAMGFDTCETAHARIARELNVIYSSLTLPSSRLVVTYPASDGGSPSFVVTRLSEMFGLPVLKSDEADRLSEAFKPCFELAALSESMPDSGMAAAARAYFAGTPELGRLLEGAGYADAARREKLSRERARLIYGGELRLSASRVDSFNSCRFAFFMERGLRAGTRGRAKLDAPAAGTFLHYILENTAREIMASGGFENVDGDVCAVLAARYADEYAKRELRGFGDKTGRFRYMYGRLAAEAGRIATDMADELKRSDFKPIEFEYKFSGRIQCGERAFELSGLIDRLDSWSSGDRRYVRVIDYKTGSKSFDLSDVRYGLNAQMLIYLSALRKRGADAQGAIPAGMLYVPAREVIVDADRNTSDAELQKLRAEKLKRSGVLLNDPDVLQAMEPGGVNTYLPVTRKSDGAYAGGALITSSQFERLLAYVDGVLERVAAEIADGEIAPNPYSKGGKSPCDYCDYAAACGFDERSGDARRRLERLGGDAFWALLEDVT